MANLHASGPRAWLLGSTALLPVAFAAGPGLAQSPTSGQVVGGSATITQAGNTTVITQSTNRGAINWQQFDVGRNQAVQFQQPNAGSWTLNRVTGPNPSSIAGSITANGGIAIVNPSGVVFAGTAQVNVANLIASTAGISNENFMAGRMLFDQPGRPGARVENHGSITVADRGMAALVAPGVSNTGTIRARLGRVALQGAEAFALDLNGDGLLSIDVTQAVRTAPAGGTALVTNSGTIDAPGGSVLISAHAASGLVEDLVRQSGRVSVDAVGAQAGQVAITATGGGVRVEGAVSAVGAAANQRGGSIAVRGSTTTRVASTARIDASGGAGGGTVVVGTTGVGRAQTMSGTTQIDRGATIRADATANGTGGTIAVNATDRSDIEAAFSARGGPLGGDGGFIELSGQGSMRLNAGLDLAAPAGRAGTFLLDPRNIRVVEDAAMPADTAGAVTIGGAGSDIDTNPGATVTASTGGAGSVLFIQASKLNALGAGAIQLEAKEDISIQGAINRAGDTLRLFANGAIDQSLTGTITAGTLVIRALNGTAAAGSATLGLQNAIGVLDAKVTGGLTLNNFATALSVSNAASSNAVLITTKSLTLNGAVGGAGASVTLRADGAIDQTGGAVTASTLRIRAGDDAAAAASAVLGKTNAVTTLDALSAGVLTLNNGTTALGVTNATGSAVSLTTTKAMVLNGAVGTAGGTVALNSDAAITQSTAGITTGTLTIRGSNGTGGGLSATLAQANAVDVLDAKVSGSLVVNNFATALSVTNATGSDVTLLLTKDIVLNGAVGGSGAAVTLRSDGAVSQTSGGVTAASLRIRAGDDASAIGKAVLDQTNAVGSLDALATGAVTLNNGSTALTVARAVGDAVTLTTTKGLAITGTVGSGDGFVALRADGAITQTGSGAVATTTLTIRGADGTAAAPSAVLGKTNNVAALDALATGTLTFDNGSRALTVNNATGSAVSLITTKSIALNGAVGGNGATVTLRATQGVTQTAAGVTADTLVIRAQDGVAATSSAVMVKTNAVGALDALAVGELTLDNGTTNLSVTNAAGDPVTLITKGNLVLAGDVGGTAAAVTLRADGGITQDSGIITATGLRIRGADDLAGAGSATLGKSNDVAILNAEATGALSFTGAGSFDVTRAAGSSVTLVSPNTLTVLGSGAGGGGIEAVGDIALGSTGLTIDAVTGTNGDAAIRSTGGSGTVSLRSDGITGAGLVSATLGGTVEFGPNTAARPTAIITGAAPGSLVLAPGLLTTQVVTGTLRLGETTIGGTTRRGGALTLTDALAPTDLQVKSAIELVAGGNVSLGGALGRSGLGLSVRSSGQVGQGAAAPVTAGTLTIRGVAGGTTGADGVTLIAASNKLDGLDAVSTQGIAVRSVATTDLAILQARSTGTSQTVAVTGGGGASLSGAVGGTGANIGLNFSGNIDQPTGAITAATLTIRDAVGGTTLVGKVALDQANAVGKIDIAAGGGLSFANGSTDLFVNRATTAAGVVTTSLTTTGKMEINASLGTDAKAIIALNATGAISQTGGIIQGSSLTIRGGAGGNSGAGGVTLGKLNAVAALDGISTAGLTLNNGTTNLSVTRAEGTAVTLTTTGGLTAKGAIGGTGAIVGLNVDGAIGQSGGAITAATLTIRDATTGTSGAAGVGLTQANAVAKLDAISTKDLSFVNGATDILVTRASAGAGQAVALTADAGMILGTVGGAGVNTINLSVTGDLSQGSGGIAGSALIIRGTGGASSGPASVILGQASNAVATLDAISLGELTYTNGATALDVQRATTGAGQVVSITGAGAVDLSGAVGGTGTTDVRLFVAGSLTQSLGTITAGTLTITNVDGTGSAASAALTLANSVARLDAKTKSSLFFNNGGTDLSVLRASTGTFAATTLVTTGALDLAGAVGGSFGNVVLRANGAVSQSASGITGLALTVADAAGTGAAGSIDLMQANAIGSLTARATGAVAVNAVGDLTVLRAAGTTVALTAGGALAVQDSAFGGLGIQGTTSVGLTAGSLSIGTGPGSNGGAGVRATDATGTVSLRTDTLNWTGLVSAPALVEIGPLLSSTPIIVTSGAATPGTMTINPGLLTDTRVQTSTLRIGSTTIGGSTVFGNGVTVETALSPTSTAVTDRLQLVAGGTGAISINGALGRTGLAVELLTAGDISQGAFGAISAGTLLIAGDGAGTVGAGAVSLLNANNAISTVQALGSKILGLVSNNDLSVQGFTSGAGQAVTLTSAGKLDLAGDVGGAGTSSLVINVGQGLTQSGGTITTKSLSIRGATGGSTGAGSIALDRANSAGALDAIAVGSLSFVNGKADLSVGRATAGAGQTVTLTSGAGLDLAGAVGGTATTAVALNAAGALTQSGGAVTASSLTIRDAAGGSSGPAGVSLAKSNAVGSLDAISTKDLAFTNGGTSLSVSLATAAAGQTVTLTSGAGLDLAGAVGGTATTAVALNVAGALTQSGGAVTASSLTIRDAAGGSSGPAGVALGLTNSVASLDAISTKDLAFTNDTTDLSVAQALAAAGQAVTLTSGGKIDLAGAVGGTATTAVRLNLPGALSQSGGAVTASSLTIRDAAGGSSGPAGVSLAKSNAVGSLDAISTKDLAFTNGGTSLGVARATGGAGQTVTLTSGSGLDLAGAVGGTATTAVALNAVGALTQSGGAVTASSLTIRDAAGGSSGPAGVSLAKSNAVGSLDAISTKDLAFTNGATDLSVGLATAGAGQTVTLTSGAGLDLAGAVGGTATTAVALNAAGALTQSGGAVTASSLTIRDAAGGSSGPAGVSLAKSNAVGSLDAISTKDLAFTNGATSLVVARATGGAGQTVTLTSGAGLDLAGAVGGTATTAVALNAVGALSQSAGAVTAGSLTIRDAEGGSSGPAGVTLGLTNSVASLDAISTKDLAFTNGATSLGVARATGGAGQTVTLTSGAGLDLAGAVGGTATTAVALNAAGALTQSAGAVTASSLTIRDAAGGSSGPAGVTLGLTNSVASLDAISTKDLAFTNGATSLSVGLAIAAAGQTVTLTGGAGLDLAGAVGGTATTAVALNAAGALTQSGGAVTASSLTIRDAAGGSSGPAGVSLAKSNAVGSLDAISTKDLAFTNGATSLSVGLATAAAGQTVTLTSGAGLDLAGAVGGTSTTAVALNVAGALTQSGGAVTASSLTIRDAAGGSSGPAGVTLGLTNSVASLDAISTKDLAFTNDTADLSVAQALAAAGQTVTLTSGGKIELAGAVGGTATTAVRLNLPGALSQSGGAVTASSLTVRDTAGGSSGPAGVSLAKSNAVGSLDAISTKDLAFTNGATSLSVARATGGAGQTVTLTSGAGLDLAGAVGGTATTAVRLNLPGALNQSAGAVTASSLTIRDAAGGSSGPAGVSLAKSNAVGSLDAISTKDLAFTNGATDLGVARATGGAGQTVTLTSGAGLDLAGAVGGTATTAVALNAVGALSQSAGAVTAGSLTIRDAAGGSSGPAGVTLGLTNSVASLDAISTKDLAFTNGATSLGVARATGGAGQTVTLTSGAGLDLAGAVGGTATTAVALNAAGALTQSGGAVTAGSLTIRDAAGGSSGPAGVALGLTNSVASLDAISTKDLAFTNGATSFSVARATGGTGQTVTLTSGAGLDLAGAVGGTATTAVRLNLPGALTQSAGAVTASSLTIRDAAGGSSGPAGVSLAKSNAVGSLDAISTKDLAFTNGATDLSVAQALAAAGQAVTLTSGGKIDLAGAVGGTATTAVALNAAGALTQSGGAVTASSLTIRDAAGGSSGPAGVSLAKSNAVGSLDAISTKDLAFTNGGTSLSVSLATAAAGQTVTLTSGAGLDLAGAVGGTATTAVALNAAGALTQSGGAVTASSLTVRDAAGGSSGPAGVSLAKSNAVGSLDAISTKDLAFTNGGTDLSVAQALAAAGQAVTLTSGGKIDLAGAVGGTATTTVALNAAGALTQSAGAVTASSLTIRDAAGGSSGPAGVALGLTNSVASLDAISTKDLAFTNGATSLGVARATGGAGQTVTLTSGAGLDLAGAVGGTATTAVALNAAGALTQSGGAVTASSLTIRDAAGGSSGPAGVALGLTNSVGKIDIVSTKGLLFLNGPGDLAVTRATTGTGQAITITGGGKLDLAGDVGGAGTTVGLFSLGALSQSGGSITTATLTIRDVSGGSSGPAGLALTRVNTVGSLDAISTKDLAFTNGATDLVLARASAGAGRAVTITTGAKLDLAGTVGGAATTVLLNAPGALSQSGGIVTAASLTIRDSDGGGSGPASIQLGKANLVDSLDGIATGALAFTNAASALSVVQALGSSVTLAGGAAIDLAGAVGRAGTTSVTVTASGTSGPITQSAGIVTAGTLNVSGPASITLGRDNRLGAIQANAGSGDIGIRTLLAADVAASTGAGTVSLTGAALTIASVGGTSGIVADAVVLNATGGSIGQSQAITGIGAAAGASLSATATDAVSLGNAANRIASVTGSAAAGFDLVTASALDAGSIAAGSIALTGPSIAVSGTLTAPTIGLTATSGALTQATGGALAGAGGGGTVLTAVAGTTIGLTAAGNRIADATLSAGSLASPADAALASAVGLTLRTASLGAGTSPVANAGVRNLTVNAPSLVLAGVRTTGNLAITTTGGVAQTVGLATGGLLSLSAGGSVTLDRSDNAFANLGVIAAGGTTVLRSASSLVATNTISVTNGLTLQSAADITLLAGGTTQVLGSSATLVAGGAMTLRAGITADTGIALTAGTAMTVDGISLRAIGGDATLTAGGAIGLAGGAAVRAGGAASLQSGGAINAAAATITGARVALTAGSDITLGTANVAATAGNAALVANAGSITLGGTPGTTATIEATGQASVQAATLVALGTGGGNATVTGGTVSIRAGTSLGIGATGRVQAQAGDATLVAGTTIGITGGSGASATGTLGLQAGGAVTLASTASGGSILTGGNVNVTSGGPVDLATGVVRATGGSVTLAANGGALTLRNGGSLAASDSIRATATGNIALTGAAVTAGGEAVLTAGGGLNLTASSATTTGGSLRLSATGAGIFQSSTLSGQGGVVVTTGGGISANALTVAANGGDARFTAGGSAGFTASRISARDTISVSAAASMAFTDTVIDPTTVLLTTAGDFTGNGLVGQSSGLFRIAAGGQVILTTSAFTADVFEVVAGTGTGQVSFSGVSIAVDTGALVAAPGGVLMTGLVTVTPGATGRFAPLVIDTRRGVDAYTAFPTDARPDAPGVQPADQSTQVATRLTPVSAFVPAASADPGGDVLLNLSATNLPVFLLLNGGSASGVLDAGRLGIHGTGGKVEVSGRLGQFEGSAAASQASLSTIVAGAFAPGSQQNYRFNNCVIGAFTCNVLAVLTPIPPPTTQQAELRIAANPRDPDALLPNIAEEDY